MTQEISSNNINAETKKKKKRRPLYKVFFLDVLVDKRTRPIIVYAILMVVLGAALFHYLEGWEWLDSLYFVVITLTTIGYGDFAPTTPVTKLITIFFGLNGIMLLLMVFDTVRTLRGWEINPNPLDD